MKVTVSDLKPASYNPRIMDFETKEALKASMKEFSDISGITWNKTTGNIVTGHHRWANLLDLYGEENLDFKPLTKTRYAIVDKSSKEDTGFVLRVVEWDEIREKAANISANNQRLAGDFTPDLTDLLDEIKTEFDYSLMSDLRLDFDFNFSQVSDEKEDDETDSKKVNVKEHERELDYSDKNKEIDLDSFGSDLEHKCPKCGFEFND